MDKKTQLKMFDVLKNYVKANLITFSAVFYFVFSAVLNVLTGINICIPCIWKALFNITCPGCGLTTAFISLLKLDIKRAFEANWLIFIILPFGLYYFAKDFKGYQQKALM